MSGSTFATVAHQRELITSGRASPLEIVDDALARVAEVQPTLNCFVEIWGDEARERARALGPHDGRPLFGIPVAIKDTSPWEGHRLTLGSRTHSSHVADSTGWVVERLLAAGAVIVGSTNTPEFAHAGITDNLLHGATRNPWNSERTTGGSSGGSAAAVASGCVAVAEGSDMGGSVRIPAAWCGLVGLKPSLGRIPMDVLPGLWDLISHHGPLARSVDDAWEFLLATQGPSLRDPYSVHPPIERDTIDLSSLKAAWSVDLGCWAVDDEIARAVVGVVELVGDAGAKFTAAPPLFTAHDNHVWLQLWGIFMAAYYGDFYDTRADDLDRDVRSLIEYGRALSAVDAKRLEIDRTVAWKRVASVLGENDVIICPTMSQPPGPATKALNDRRGVSHDDGRHHSEDMTSVWNLVSPLPIVSVPAGRHSGANSGLPIGVQVVGRPGREDVVLAVARHIERAVGAPNWR
jgi:Asp-tRNA(Asn)/Glu-tRNA(Gln) amidotransferase A subunit family amidase